MSLLLLLLLLHLELQDVRLEQLDEMSGRAALGGVGVKQRLESRDREAQTAEKE